METPKEIIEYRPVEAGLALLREKYAGVVFDVATANGLDDARKARAEIREPRYECEKIRKRLKAPALEYSRRIDTEAARITAELQKLETPIDLVIKTEEDAAEARREAKRRAEIERQIELRRMVESINEWPLLCLALTAQGLREAIARYEQHEIPSPPEIPPHYAEAAAGAAVRALEKLREMLVAQEAREAEEARLAAEREQQERWQAAERQRQKEEQALFEREKEEEARHQAIERERQAAEDKRLREERRRVEALRAEAERRAAEERAELDRQHAEHARVERELAEERARMEADRARVEPSVPWEEPSPPPEPASGFAPSSEDEKEEVPARVSGTTVMRVRFEKSGGHYHCRVFTRKHATYFAKNGDLVFDEAEWPDIPLLMRGAEFVEEETAWP